MLDRAAELHMSLRHAGQLQVSGVGFEQPGARGQHSAFEQTDDHGQEAEPSRIVIRPGDEREHLERPPSRRQIGIGRSLLPRGGDGCGRMQHTGAGTATFTVRVVDTTAPALDPVGDHTAEATSPSGAAVSYPLPAATDAVSAPAVVCAPLSGTVFALGSTPISCAATDAAGNSSTVSGSVTVADTTPPTCTTFPSDIVVTATSATGASVQYAVPTAADVASASVTVACERPAPDQCGLRDRFANRSGHTDLAHGGAVLATAPQLPEWHVEDLGRDRRA